MLLADDPDGATWLAAAAHALLEPLWSAPWTDVRHFWGVLVLGERILCFYILPVIALLALVPPRHVRGALIATGLVAVAYFFGLPFAALWLLLCAGLHGLTQQLWREFRRTDVWHWGPPIAAWLMIGGGYVLVTLAGQLQFPEGWTRWAYERCPLLLPFGYRGFAFEPDFRPVWGLPTDGPPPYLFLMLTALSHYVGLAYLAIRMLHYVSELARDTIPPERRTLTHFLAYTCYFPTLIQGPIERYQRFQDELDTCGQRRGGRAWVGGVPRILFGLGQCLFAVLYLEPWVHELRCFRPDSVYYNHPEQIASYATLYFGVFAPVLWLYFHFSGYSDIVIGMSRLFGVRLSENFEWPWFATSLTELWRRWHITLSLILRDYIFTPLTRKRVSPRLNLFITFVFCGLWHGFLMKFVWWGVTMGVMVNINHSWARWMRDINKRRDTALHKVRAAWLRLHPLPSILAWALTIHAFALSTVFFFGTPRSYRVVLELLRRPVEALLGTGGGG